MKDFKMKICCYKVSRNSHEIHCRGGSVDSTGHAFADMNLKGGLLY